MTIDDTKRRFIKGLLDDREFTRALMQAERAFNELVGEIVSGQADTITRHFTWALSVSDHVDIATAIVAGWYLGLDGEIQMAQEARHDRVYRRSLIASLAAKYASDALAAGDAPRVH